MLFRKLGPVVGAETSFPRVLGGVTSAGSGAAWVNKEVKAWVEKKGPELFTFAGRGVSVCSGVKRF